jgi:hypothetical protein
MDGNVARRVQVATCVPDGDHMLLTPWPADEETYS